MNHHHFLFMTIIVFALCTTLLSKIEVYKNNKIVDLSEIKYKQINQKSNYNQILHVANKAEEKNQPQIMTQVLKLQNKNMHNQRILTQDPKNINNKNPEQITKNNNITTQKRLGFFMYKNIASAAVIKPQKIATLNIFQAINGNTQNRIQNSKNTTTSIVVNTTLQINKQFRINVNIRDIAQNNQQINNPEFDFRAYDLQKGNSNFIFAFNRKLGKPSPITLKYADYIKRYKPNSNKISLQQFKFRQSVFQLNRGLINSHNQKVQRSFNIGLNQFTDISLIQFKQLFHKLKIPEELSKNGILQQAILRKNNLLSYTTPPRIIIDWSCKASDVISQGVCGASYVIAPLQAIAITMRIYNYSAKYLSIQQVLSCGNQYRKQIFCKEGYFADVYDYVQKFGVGQSLQYFYDQKAKFQGFLSPCNRLKTNNRSYRRNKVFIIESQRIKFGDCKQLVEQLRFRAISVAISGDDLQFYTEGTYQTTANQISHGVTLVGYNPNIGYLVKNSWGKSWGTGGYAYVSESTGICNYAMYPILLQEFGRPNQCFSRV